MAEKTYEWNSSDYSRNSSAQFQWASELIDKLALKGTEDVLDIGCGDGRITAEIATHLPNGSVMGIDNSKEMIAHAKKNFPETKHKNLCFQVTDAREIRFADRFDLAFSTSALHWISDHHLVLEGVKRSLKKKGRILFQMGGKGNAQEILDILGKMMKAELWKTYFEDFSFAWGFYDAETYSRLLKEAGFKPLRVELIPKDMTQMGREGLAGWIRTTWLPYLERIPANQKEEFINRIIDEYLKNHEIDREGLIHLKMVRLEVAAAL